MPSLQVPPLPPYSSLVFFIPLISTGYIFYAFIYTFIVYFWQTLWCIESTIRAGILPVSFLLLLLHYQHLKWCLIYSDHLINISYWINLKLSSIISLVAPLKKSLKCKCFQKAIGLFLPPVSYFIILPLLNLSLFFLIFKCYVETHLDVPCPQALLSATLSLWLQFLHAKLLGQSLSTLPPLLTLLPQNLLQPHFHRNSSRKVSLKRSVVTSSPNIMLCLNIKSYIWPC